MDIEIARIALWLLAAVLVLAGLAGTVLPAIPGAALVFGGLLLAAWADGFVHVGGWSLAALGFLAVLTYGVDFAATAVGAKRVGASGRAVVGAAIGTLVGLFFGIPGILLGPFLGAVVGEYTVRRKLGEASKAGFGTWLGLALGAALKLALVFTMLGVFALAFFL